MTVTGETVAGESEDEAAAPSLPPSALARWEEIAARLAGRRPVLFLDFDGTLAPIVERPEDAGIPEPTRQLLARLAGALPIVVVSGRSRADVEARVGLERAWYAGSHGFDVTGPDGFEHREDPALAEAVRRAARRLEDELGEIPGSLVEEKEYSVSVHTRRVGSPEDRERIAAAVQAVLAGEPELERRGGKELHELRPRHDWDKGRSVLLVLDAMRERTDGTGAEERAELPLYLGDDETDEDAFRSLTDRGVGIVVSAAPRPTLADYSLTDPEEVRAFLGRLLEHLTAGPDTSAGQGGV